MTFKPRDKLIAEIAEITEGLSMLWLLRLHDFGRAVQRQDRKEKAEKEARLEKRRRRDRERREAKRKEAAAR